MIAYKNQFSDWESIHTRCQHQTRKVLFVQSLHILLISLLQVNFLGIGECTKEVVVHDESLEATQLSCNEGFKFFGAGSSLFSSPGKQQDDEEDGGEDGEGGHDPYFEPIVPLPELVEVKTGEEDEEVLFKHRAKVYRYCGETKQWKERGVGDIKILKHKVSSVHRVLLRRDQVHKIVANHRITAGMELKPLASSETAWCWYAMDFSEGHETEGSLEHLAVRFKTVDAAQEFKGVFKACQEGKETKTTAVANNAAKDSTVDERAEVEPDPRDEEEGEEEYGEEDEDYEAGETIMFHQVSRQF